MQSLTPLAAISGLSLKTSYSAERLPGRSYVGVGLRFSVNAVEWLVDRIEYFRLDRDEQLLNALAEFLDRTWSGARAMLHDRGSIHTFHRLLRRVAETGKFVLGNADRFVRAEASTSLRFHRCRDALGR
jgi:hypothetical protein